MENVSPPLTLSLWYYTVCPRYHSFSFPTRFISLVIDQGLISYWEKPYNYQRYSSLWQRERTNYLAATQICKDSLWCKSDTSLSNTLPSSLMLPQSQASCKPLSPVKTRSVEVVYMPEYSVLWLRGAVSNSLSKHQSGPMVERYSSSKKSATVLRPSDIK